MEGGRAGVLDSPVNWRLMKEAKAHLRWQQQLSPTHHHTQAAGLMWTVNLACPVSLSSSLIPSMVLSPCSAQAIMKLSVTSHPGHWAVFKHRPQIQTELHSVWEHTWQLWTQTHLYTVIHPGGKAVDERTFFSYPSSSVTFWVPLALWLELSIYVCCWGWPYHRAPWQHMQHDTNTYTCIVWIGASQFPDKEKCICKRWPRTQLPSRGGERLTFGYWVFTVHVYFSWVIYNSISSVHWCASYLQNTKQSPNPIVFQSN